MHELTEIRKERPMSVRQSAKNQQKTVKYQLGNESIIRRADRDQRKGQHSHGCEYCSRCIGRCCSDVVFDHAGDSFVREKSIE